MEYLITYGLVVAGVLTADIILGVIQYALKVRLLKNKKRSKR